MQTNKKAEKIPSAPHVREIYAPLFCTMSLRHKEANVSCREDARQQELFITLLPQFMRAIPFLLPPDLCV